MRNDRGFFDSTFALYVGGITVAIWLISVIMGWIFETKEQRAARRLHSTKTHLAEHLTKEEIIKYGVGEFDAKCMGIIVKNCSISAS